jgi:hypothetical protein
MVTSLVGLRVKAFCRQKALLLGVSSTALSHSQATSDSGVCLTTSVRKRRAVLLSPALAAAMPWARRESEAVIILPLMLCRIAMCGLQFKNANRELGVHNPGFEVRNCHLAPPGADRVGGWEQGLDGGIEKRRLFRVAWTTAIALLFYTSVANGCGHDNGSPPSVVSGASPGCATQRYSAIGAYRSRTNSSSGAPTGLRCSSNH